MIIGDRLRAIREQKNLSQGAIEKRTGLLRCYISRVENGHTVPAVETLEKFARALEMPLYQVLYDGDKLPRPPSAAERMASQDDFWVGKNARFLHKLRQNLSRMDEADRRLLLFLASKMAQQSRPRSTAQER